LFVPIHHNEQLIGFLGLEHSDPRHKYAEEEMALAQAVGHLAALIIERRRLTRAREEAESREIASQEAQRRLDEFLSVVSHELRAPLTLIKGSVQLAERRLRRISVADLDQEDIRERVEGATDLLRRADRQIRIENRLVSDLLDASRIHADRLDLFMKPIDLATLAGETVEEMRQVHPGRTILFTAKCATPTTVSVDPDRISQVIVNYLTNALKYSPPNTPIECWLECGQGYARLSVRDQGMGIPLEEHERIWGRFQRAEYNQRGLGLGLGLYICHNIIERHHGQVGLESTPGQGATFWFTLPLPAPEGDG
jgi:signal transduction histidine kinase